MYLKSLQITFFITLFFIVNCFGQTAEGEKWTRIDTTDQELSLAFPPDYIVNAEGKQFGRVYKITGFINNVTVQLSVSKRLTDGDLKMMLPPEGMSAQSFTKKDLKGIRSSNNPADPGLNEIIAISGDKNYYYISVTASDRKKPEIERFLYSIRIRGESLFKNPNAPNYPESSVALKSLNSSTEVIEALERKLEKKKFKVEKNISTENPEIMSYAEYSRAPIVVEQPTPSFRPNFENMSPSGFSFQAKLKLTLLADGQVGDIKIVSGGSSPFVDACVEAARKLRFIPAQKNGVNADSVKIIEYNMRGFRTTTTVTFPPGLTVPLGSPF